jgi:hypothetical protein
MIISSILQVLNARLTYLINCLLKIMLTTCWHQFKISFLCVPQKCISTTRVITNAWDHSTLKLENAVSFEIKMSSIQGIFQHSYTRKGRLNLDRTATLCKCTLTAHNTVCLHCTFRLFVLGWIQWPYILKTEIYPNNILKTFPTSNKTHCASITQSSQLRLST